MDCDGTFASGRMYLHVNGDLIYKPNADPADLDDSPFVKKHWMVDGRSRLLAWRIIIEALALGAHLPRVRDLSRKWSCNIIDFHHYLKEETASGPVSKLKKNGAEMFLRDVVGYTNPNAYWAWLAATPKGAEPDLATIPLPSDDSIGYEPDGNAWMAYRPATFTNPQESATGFGPTKIEALKALQLAEANT